MPELIYREAALKKMCEMCYYHTSHDFVCRKCNVYELLEKQPAVEAEPVRHGRWIANGKRSVFGDLEYLCSECGRKITANWAVSDPSKYNAFCSGCGARMDGGDDNG